MTRPSKDLKYKANEKDLDSVLEMKLRQWMTARPRLLEPDVQQLFKRMHEFALEIRMGGFGPAINNLANDDTGFLKAISLTELIADRLCEGIDGSDNGIKIKSLQETLYLCTGIRPELLPPEFGRRFEDFLALSGSKGFIRVFLRVHLANLIFRDLRDSLQGSALEELCDRTEAIDRMCQKVADAAVRPVNDWPELDGSLMASLLLDLKAEMTRMLNNEVSFYQGA
jgi:hypothetical protein